MVMTHFYQKNVFESCLKISARLRAEILQIRVKTGHFGVKMGITISSSSNALGWFYHSPEYAIDARRKGY